MNLEVPSLLIAALEPGEKLLWWDLPPHGLLFRPEDTMMTLFGGAFFGFSLFWEAAVNQGNAPLFFTLWGIPFILAGFYMLIGRFFYDAWQRRRTVYGLTNLRAVIVTPGTIKTIDLAGVSQLNLKMHGDNGFGSIYFGPGPSPISSPAGIRTPYSPPPSPAFERIADVRRIYDKLRSLQQQQRSEPA